MKRTFLLSILMLVVISIFSASIYTNSYASNAFNKEYLPGFSVKIVDNANNPISGASVTITFPDGYIGNYTSNNNGLVCVNSGWGMVRVSWVGPSKGLNGCRDINNQTETLCGFNPYTVGLGNLCTD
ncbi:MAG: hypothetical protein ABI543_00120 [Ignavibacteria bacterium]